MIFDLINEAYKIENGNDGIAFKEMGSPRLMSTDELNISNIHVATIGHQIVGAMNISVDNDVAIIGGVSLT